MLSNTPIQRIKEFIDTISLNVSSFEKKVSMSNGSFASQLKKNKSIGIDKLENILKEFPQINANWLLTGKGDMLLAMPKEYKPTLQKASVVAEPNTPSYPLLELEAFAGAGDTSEFGTEIDRLEERYVIPSFKGLKIDFMIKVNGSSMYPKYNSGDVVACRSIDELLYLQWNKVYVIDTVTNGVMIKRVKKGTDEASITLKSDNKDYDDFSIPRTDIRNIALVVGVIRLE